MMAVLYPRRRVCCSARCVHYFAIYPGNISSPLRVWNWTDALTWPYIIKIKQLKLIWPMWLLCGKFRRRYCCVTSGSIWTTIRVILLPIGDLITSSSVVYSSKARRKIFERSTKDNTLMKIRWSDWSNPTFTWFKATQELIASSLWRSAWCVFVTCSFDRSHEHSQVSTWQQLNNKELLWSRQSTYRSVVMAKTNAVS